MYISLWADGLLNFSWFFRCGIIPVDRTQYPSSRFNSILKNRYHTWVADWKNDIPAEEFDTIINGTSDNKSATNTAKSIPASNSKFNSTNTPKEVTYNSNQN